LFFANWKSGCSAMALCAAVMAASQRRSEALAAAMLFHAAA